MTKIAHSIEQCQRLAAYGWHLVSFNPATQTYTLEQ